MNNVLDKASIFLSKEENLKKVIEVGDLTNKLATGLGLKDDDPILGKFAYVTAWNEVLLGALALSENKNAAAFALGLTPLKLVSIGADVTKLYILLSDEGLESDPAKILEFETTLLSLVSNVLTIVAARNPYTAVIVASLNGASLLLELTKALYESEKANAPNANFEQIISETIANNDHVIDLIVQELQKEFPGSGAGTILGAGGIYIGTDGADYVSGKNTNYDSWDKVHIVYATSFFEDQSGNITSYDVDYTKFSQFFGCGGNDTITSYGANNIISGGDGNDSITSYGANSAIYGGDGNDRITSNGSDSTIYGGGGRDSIGSYRANNIISGGDGNDSIISSGANSTIYGDSGDDGIISSGTNSTIYGGDGDDDIHCNALGSNLLDGGSGNDIIKSKGTNSTIYGGDGDDDIDYDALGDSTLYGGDGDDIMTSKGTNSTIYGDDGDDSIDCNASVDNSLHGGSGNDIIHSRGTNSYIDGGDGNDTIIGRAAGNTFLDGGDGNDIISSETGMLYSNGTISYFNGAVSYYGGAGNDILNGGAGIDTFIFDKDNEKDVINNISNQDILSLGAGIEIANIRLIRGIGNNNSYDLTLDFGNGDSVLLKNYLFGSYYAINIKFSDGTKLGYDQIVANLIYNGTSGNDTLYGLPNSAKYNRINGNDGNDYIVGGAGDNTLDGGSGDDTLYSNGTNNTIYGGEGNDFMSSRGTNSFIYGGDGSDSIYGQASGDNTLDGGSGDDTLYSNGTNNTIYGDDGNDILTAGSGLNSIKGGAGNDTLNAGSGINTFIFNKGDGQDVINEYNSDYRANKINQDNLQLGVGIAITNTSLIRSGNEGNDLTLDFGNGDSVLLRNYFIDSYKIKTIKFSDDSELGYDQIVANLIYNGTSGNDVLNGFANLDNTINGNGGNDTVNGSNGNDNLYGGIGSDLLSGNIGNDILHYSQDMLQWNSTIRARNTGSPDSLDSGKEIVMKLKYHNTDAFDGGLGNDTLIMTDDNDALFLDDKYSDNPLGFDKARIKDIEIIDAGKGNDLVDLTSSKFSYGDIGIYGREGNDFLWSSSGNDNLNGGAGKDQLDGGSGNDSLYGEAGNDTLYGKSGNDILNGGAGIDLLFGGLGNDSFDFSSLSDSTVNAADVIEDFVCGEDKIDLSGLDQHIAYDNLQFSFDDDYTLVKDLNSDFAFYLKGIYHLLESDFML